MLLLKYIIIGPSGVGKSSLLLQYTDSKFSDTHCPTIGVEFGIRILNEFKGKNIKMQIWDTAGQESFRSLTSSYYRGAHGALIVYDITSRESFQHLGTWLEDVKLNSGEEAVITVVGNKADLEEKREVSKEEGEQFALRNKIQFCEVSAIEESDIDGLFKQSITEIIEKMGEGKFARPQSIHSLTHNYAGPPPSRRFKAEKPPSDTCGC